VFYCSENPIVVQFEHHLTLHLGFQGPELFQIFMSDDAHHQIPVGKRIMDLGLPAGVIIAIIRRKGDSIIPKGNVVLKAGDLMVLGSEPYDSKEHIKLKEIVLEKQNPWTGMLIKELDISRHSIIVLVKRENKSLIPKGDLILREGDKVFLYTQLHLAHTNDIEI